MILFLQLIQFLKEVRKLNNNNKKDQDQLWHQKIHFNQKG